MNSHFRLSRRAALFGAGAIVAAPSILGAQTPMRLRFNLGWRFEAGAAGFVLAAERGFFRDEGIDVTIDAGNGSAGAVNAVASGAYGAATADIMAMIAHNVRNPTQRLIATGIQYDLNPNAIMVRAEGPIRTPRDLIGTKIAGQPFNASRAQFPAFARAVGIPVDTIQWQNVEPGLGFQLFIRGEIDGAASFFMTGLLSLKAAGFPLERTRTFRFSDHGVNGYGNAIIINPRLAEENPRLVSGMMRAIARGWVATIADPAAGVRALKAREPLTDEAIELERLNMMITGTKVTPATRANGFLAATQERMRQTIDEAVLALALPTTPTVAETYTDRFLPPIADRRLPANV